MWKHKLYYSMCRLKRYDELRLGLLLDYNKGNMRRMYTETKRVFAELRDLDVLYVVIKGAVLNNLAYRGMEYRTSTDIDILIDKKDIGIVDKILCENGFRQGFVDSKGRIQPFPREKRIYNDLFTHQTLPYIKKINNSKDGFIMFDINATIYWTEAIEFDVKSFLEKRICDMDISDTTIKCCNPIGNFIITCLHHYKDLNSDFMLLKNGYSMNLFFDIYYLLINNYQFIDMDELKKVSEELDIKKYIYYCLFFTNQIFHNSLIEEYIKKLDVNEEREVLEVYGLDISKKRWNISFEERFNHKKVSDDIRNSMTENDKRRIEVLFWMMKN